jgi:hypothetical protein
MTQPYGPPSYYAHPAAAQSPAPFKKTGIVMFVVAGFLLLLSGGMAMVSRMPFSEMPEPQRSRLVQMDQELQDQTGVGLKEGLVGVSVVLLVPAILTAAFAIGVLRRRRGWVIASMILIGLLALFMVLQVSSALLQSRGDPMTMMGVVIFLIPLGLLILLLFWLAACYRFTKMTPTPSAPAGYWQTPTAQAQPLPPQQGYGYQREMQKAEGRSQNEEDQEGKAEG